MGFNLNFERLLSGPVLPLFLPGTSAELRYDSSSIYVVGRLSGENLFGEAIVHVYGQKVKNL